MDNMQETAESVEQEGDRLRQRVRDVADAAYEKGREKWNDFRNRSGDAMNQARQRGSEMWEDTEELVRKYPGKSIGLALLVGTLIGVLLTVRSDD